LGIFEKARDTTAPQFFCEKIEVEIRAAGPEALLWRGKRYEVREVLRAWHDFGFPLGMRPKRAGWRVRHRREYFRVLTKDGHTFELYHDRGKKRREWVLSKRID